MKPITKLILSVLLVYIAIGQLLPLVYLKKYVNSVIACAEIAAVILCLVWLVYIWKKNTVKQYINYYTLTLGILVVCGILSFQLFFGVTMVQSMNASSVVTPFLSYFHITPLLLAFVMYVITIIIASVELKNRLFNMHNQLV